MLTKTHLKTAQTLYLYPDGHAAVVHKRRDKFAGEIHWVTLHETIGATLNCWLRTELEEQRGERADVVARGRLIVTRYAIPMIARAVGVSWTPFETRHGTLAMQRAGIAASVVTLRFMTEDYGGMHIMIPADRSGDLVPQCRRDYYECWENVVGRDTWSDMRVGEVIRAGRKAA